LKESPGIDRGFLVSGELRLVEDPGQPWRADRLRLASLEADEISRAVAGLEHPALGRRPGIFSLDETVELPLGFCAFDRRRKVGGVTLLARCGDGLNDEFETHVVKSIRLAPQAARPLVAEEELIEG
jgi:hypothetical protein